MGFFSRTNRHKDDHGVGAPKYARHAQRYVKNLSIFECLEWYEAKFLGKNYNNSRDPDFSILYKSLDLLRILVAGGRIEPPTLGL